MQVLAALVLSQRQQKRDHLPLQIPFSSLCGADEAEMQMAALWYVSPSPAIGTCVSDTKAASEPTKSVHVGLGSGSQAFRVIFPSVLRTSAWAQQMWCGVWGWATAFRSSSWSPVDNLQCLQWWEMLVTRLLKLLFGGWGTVRDASYSVSQQWTCSEWSLPPPARKQTAKLTSALASQNPFAHNWAPVISQLNL